MAMSTAMALALVLSAKTGKASQEIDKFASKTANRLMAMSRKSEEYLKKGLTDVEIGRQLAKPILGLLDSAVQFEDKMADVAKFADVKVGTKAFNSLSQKAIEVSKKMGIPAAEAAESMAQLAASGTPIKMLEQMAIKAATMGKAFDISAGQAADGYKSIQAALGATDSRMDQLMDVTNALTNNFGKGKDAAAQLFTFMTSSGASVATSLKADEKFIAAIGNTMRNMGIETATAGTTMERFRNDLLKNKDAAAMFNKAGGGEKGIIAILEKAKASGNAVGWFLEHKIAGTYASQLGQLAMGIDSEKGLKNQFKSIQNPSTVEGSVDREAANRMSTNAEKLKRFNAQLEALKISAGSSLLPALNKLLTAVSPLIDKLAEWAKKNPGLIENILKLGIAIAGLKVAAGVGNIIKGAFITPIAKVYGYFSKGKEGVSLFTKHLDTLRKVKKRIGDKLFEARFFGEKYARSGAKAIQSFGAKSFNAVSTFASNSWTAIQGFAAQSWTAIQGFAVKSGNAMKTFGGIVKTNVIKGIKGIGIAFKAVTRIMMRNPWILIITVIVAAIILIIKNWDKIKEYLIKFWDWLTGWATKIKDVGINLVKAIWEGIKEKWEWLKSKATALWTSFKGLFGFGKSTAEVAVKHSLPTPAGANAYTMNTAPQIAPVRSGSNDKFSFAPVINVNGGMDNGTAQKMTAQMRRDFEKKMTDYQYNKQRKGF